MKKYLKPVFLRWVLMICLICIGTVFSSISGLPDQVNDVDLTKISFIIFGAFLIFSVRTGMLTYDAAKGNQTNKSIDKLTQQNEAGWIASNWFTFAGMIGTVIGFILMMSGAEFDNITSANVQNVIVFALGKMGLALYTTASGLICCLLLQIQLFNLTQYLNRFKPKKDEKTISMVLDE